MYCSKCGKEMPDEAVVCTGCGCLLHKKEVSQMVNKGEARGKIDFLLVDAEKQLQNKAALFSFIALCCLCVSRILTYFFGRTVFSAVIAIVFSIAATVTGLFSALLGIKQKGSLALKLLTIQILIVSFACFVISIQNIL
ncbi:MAG: hypothetical protein SPH68_04290 [Candidatus Borkfalkiaceae bacterium]|nr:hypothetical protein [Clostridia bacterium]MDY6223359.1 hypothetical protein [Christensenellaceae bacterium]